VSRGRLRNAVTWSSRCLAIVLTWDFDYSVKPIYADEHAKIPLGVTIEAHGNKGFQMYPHGSAGGGTNVFTIWNRKR